MEQGREKGLLSKIFQLVLACRCASVACHVCQRVRVKTFFSAQKATHSRKGDDYSFQTVKVGKRGLVSNLCSCGSPSFCIHSTCGHAIVQCCTAETVLISSYIYFSYKKYVDVSLTIRYLEIVTLVD